jgi:hypothetical protein
MAEVVQRPGAAAYTGLFLVNNYFRDQAVTNAKQLTGLLSSADVTVAAPDG